MKKIKKDIVDIEERYAESILNNEELDFLLPFSNQNVESFFGLMKANLNRAHKEPILCFTTQSKANRVDKWFDGLDIQTQQNYINDARKNRKYWKEFCQKQYNDYKAAKLAKKQIDSQKQRAKDIKKSQRRR